MKLFVILTCWCCFGKTLAAFVPPGLEAMEWLRNDCNFFSKVPPLRQWNDSVVISLFDFWITRFISLDEIEEKQKLLVEINMEWHHPCQWLQKRTNDSSRNNWANIERLQITEEVWLPPIFHLTGFHDVAFTDTRKSTTTMYFNADGKIRWTISGQLDSSCTLHLRKFPFDVQKCAIVFEIASRASEVRMSENETRSGFDRANESVTASGLWTVELSTPVIYNVSYYVLSNWSYSRISFEIILTRKYQRYLVSVTIPNLVLAVMQLGFVALPALSADRITYCITLMLAFSFQQATIESSIPKSSDVLYVVILTTSQMLISMVSTIYSLIILYIGKNYSSKRLYLFDCIFLSIATVIVILLNVTFHLKMIIFDDF